MDGPRDPNDWPPPIKTERGLGTSQEKSHNRPILLVDPPAPPIRPLKFASG